MDDVRQSGGIACLEGIGGIGKTALLREFVRSLGSDTPDGFVWSFYVQADADAFLSALQAALNIPQGKSALAEIRERPQFLLILDGFERMQADESPYAINDESLRHFLERFALVGPGAICFCASRLPLHLAAPVRTIHVGGLESEDAVTLLQTRGLPASVDILREVTRRYAGHPLALSLVAGAVGHFMEGDARRHEEVRGMGVPVAAWMGSAESAVTRVLGFYRERLDPQAAALLGRLSLFRGPADEHTLEAVFLHGDAAVGGDLFGIDAARLRALLEELDALGLVEHVDEKLWVAHAVVREFFPATLVDSKRVHIAVAHFLGDRPGASESRPTAHELDALEEAVYHALRADNFDFAIGLYFHNMGGSDWLRDCGELARGERMLLGIVTEVQFPASPIRRRESAGAGPCLTNAAASP